MATERAIPEVSEFVREQMARWRERAEARDIAPALSHQVVTINMAPGSGGSQIGRLIAERLGFDFFHHDIIKAIAKNAKMSFTVVDSLEKERLTGFEDFFSLLVRRHYLHPGSYQNHLVQVIGSIARHGHAVIIGRGGNFILPNEERFSVRVIATLETRIRNVARHFNTTREEAETRVVRRESRRAAFVRQTFHCDIADPLYYDMVINTDQISLEAAATAVLSAMGR